MISDSKAADEIQRHRMRQHHHPKPLARGSHAETNGNGVKAKQDEGLRPKSPKPNRFRRRSQVRPNPQAMKRFQERLSVQDDPSSGTRPTRSDMRRRRSLSPGGGQDCDQSHSRDSLLSLIPPTPRQDDDELDEAADQDIEELWYAPPLSNSMIITNSVITCPLCRCGNGRTSSS